MRPLVVIGIALTYLLAGCSPSVPDRTQAPAADQPTPRTPTRLTLAILSQPRTASTDLNTAGGIGGSPGAGSPERLLHAGLTLVDKSGARQPVLAAQTPTVENGLWRVTPDGKMDMTWKLRDGLRWHDGAPFTADDLMLTAQLSQDKEIAFFRKRPADFVESFEQIDPLTVVVHFNAVFLLADTMYAHLWPDHLLREPYIANPRNVPLLPYWSTEFVGIGPYQLREWREGVQVSMDAFDGYALGRPKIDQIVVRFIPDSSPTIFANLLAGAADLSTDRGLSFEQSVQLVQQWPDGQVGYQISGVEQLYPQHINPDPPALADVRFRRALFMAIDREELNGTLTRGTVPVADSVENVRDLEYRFIESSIVKYRFDPRQAMQMIEDLGFRKEADGKYRQPDGRLATIDIQATEGDLNVTGMSLAADYWGRIGLDVTQTLIPRQRQQDYPFRYGRTGFNIARGTGSLDLTSKQVPLPDNGWLGNNKARYQSPELDAAIDHYLTTIAFEPRMQFYGQMVHIVTDQLALMPLVNVPLVTAWNSRVGGIDPDLPTTTDVFWNVQDWTVSRS
jgi:peptide/nickel transport system substrate-binding protein